MGKSDLKITIIQSALHWEDKKANLATFGSKISQLKGQQHLIALPEMFSTGFSMTPAPLAETMDGPTVTWMKEMAATAHSIISGSVIIEEEGHFYNRMLWVLPNGDTGHYDKRHLFSYAGENEQYTSGNKRFIASVNGWKICLLVCYDLRFPVWSRNTDDYDVLLYAANWPEPRNIAWETLLRARAIENQCYTIGVNRVGTDHNDHHYLGNSSIYGPQGELIWKAREERVEAIQTTTLSYQPLSDFRSRFSFLEDRDKFVLL